MSDVKDSVLEFIDTSIDELAEAGTPFFKQLKAVFKVISSGKKVIDGLNPDDAFEICKDKLKHELKQLARSSYTDNHHMEKIMEKLKEIMNDKSTPLSLYINETELEKKLHETNGIPIESRLPKEIAIIIKENIHKVFTPAQWCVEIYGDIQTIINLSEETINKLERFEQQIQWSLTHSAGCIDELKKLIEYKGSFAECIDNTPLPQVFVNNENRFHYLNGNICFRGRESEIRQIESFLYSSDRISVWAISGQGGVGKSKLARNICERNSWCFKPIWLEPSVLCDILSIRSGYEYIKPILFVCDYSDEREKEIINLIKKMHDSNVWSRFLLIMRQSQRYDVFTKSPVVKEYKYILNSSGNATLDLSVSRLGEDTSKLIIEDFRHSYYNDKTLTEEKIRFILDKTREISPTNSQKMRDSRCLFMLLITDALLNGETNELVNSEELILLYFKRNIEHLDHNNADVGFRLLAFATAMNGLDMSDKNLPDFIRKDIKYINASFTNKEEKDAFWEKISDGLYIKNKSNLLPFEPDIIGECLFLWQFFERIDDELQSEWLDYLCDKVVNGDEHIENFVIRCMSDWKNEGVKFSRIFNEKMNEGEE